MTDNSDIIRSNLAAVQDHSRLFSTFTYVYPVISRRSRGLSLGVNLNPDKRCNFDCVYCEVDRRSPPRVRHLEVNQMCEELQTLICAVRHGALVPHSRFNPVAALARDIRDIAFSGDGEPTMIPNFAECAQAVAHIKKAEGLDQTKIVLITDAAGLDKADVKRGLEIMDANQGEIWGKLDAGTETHFRQVNRSLIRLDRILNNLLETARRRPIVIQSLFLKMHGVIMSADEQAAYCRRLTDLVQAGGQIKEVHAYTIARATPEVFATKLEPDELEIIAEAIRHHTGLPVSSFP